MSLWSQSRLIDIMSSIDIALVAEDIPEQDLEREKLSLQEAQELQAKDALEEVKPACPQIVSENTELPEIKADSKKSRKKIAVISGIAAGSLAITGVIVMACRRHGGLRSAA